MREKLSLQAESAAALQAELTALEGLREFAVLNTCNRIEFYGVAAKPEVAARITKAFCARQQFDVDEFARIRLELRGRDAVQHLVEVSAGLDSQMLGETEIFGQVKEAYAAAQGWKVAKKAVREESGVLPVVIAGDFDRYWPPSDRTARIGVRAGAFHATTGYSLPEAVRTATALPDLIGPDLPALLRERAAAGWRRQRFYRMLGAMLFRAAAPDERESVD